VQTLIQCEHDKSLDSLRSLRRTLLWLDRCRRSGDNSLVQRNRSAWISRRLLPWSRKSLYAEATFAMLKLHQIDRWIAAGVTGALFELVLVALATVVVWPLQMSLGKKVTVAMSFAPRLV
jgi:hypothetical protein